MTTVSARTTLRAVAIVSCLPYITLKIAWVAGSRVGIPDGSVLLDHRALMAVANGGSVLMDGGVVVLALLLTRPWGLRVPAWLPALPMWTATGLLLPIMTGYPAQLLVRALGGDTGGAEAAAGRPFLHEWVFGVVYGGFILQGLSLGALFVLYARDRWGHLWRGTLGELPASPTAPALRAAAVAASLLALAPGTAHLLWAAGSTAGLTPDRAAGRDSGFHVLEAVYALWIAATVAGVLLLAFRRSALPLRVPLALAWGGSGATACWGGWLCLAALGSAGEAAERATPGMVLTYAVQMLVGTLVVTLGAYFLAERAAGARDVSA